jgi:hypothetical protein
MDAKAAKEAEIERLVSRLRPDLQHTWGVSHPQAGHPTTMLLCSIHRMQAQVEMQLIERLKQKQLEQRRAYQQLEAVISLGAR